MPHLQLTRHRLRSRRHLAVGAERRRWCLLADHEVDLDRTEKMARAFFGLPGFLAAYQAIRTPEELLAEAGAWPPGQPADPLPA